LPAGQASADEVVGQGVYGPEAGEGGIGQPQGQELFLVIDQGQENGMFQVQFPGNYVQKTGDFEFELGIGIGKLYQFGQKGRRIHLGGIGHA